MTPPRFFVILFALIVQFLLTTNSSACESPGQLALGNVYPTNSSVNFYIEPTFTTAQKNSIREQLGYWNSSALPTIRLTKSLILGIGKPAGDPTLKVCKGGYRSKSRSRRSECIFGLPHLFDDYHQCRRYRCYGLCSCRFA